MWINSQITLLTTPEQRTTRNGSEMATAFCGANLGGKDKFTFGLTAFGHVADSLARYKKFDVLAIVGTLTVRQWTTKSGEERESMTCTLDGLSGIKARKPAQHESGKSSKPAAPSEPQESFATDGFGGFDEFKEDLDIPF